MQAPFYDPVKSYEENYNDGPFGAFVNGEIVPQLGKPEEVFLGQNVYSTFGIPAGPLVNSNFCKGAFEKGFDIVVYKTVRSDFYPCHPFPNILSVRVEGDLTLERAQKTLIADSNYGEPLSITNSFGVPSKKAAVWQEDVKKAISHAGPGQVLVLSFMGTVREDQTQQEFIDDYILAARLSYETGAKALEVNLSCPNIGNEGLVCYDLEVTEKVCEGIRSVIGETPLILKVGFYKNEEDIKRLALIVGKYAQAISSINTIQATIIDEDGNQALPGKNRSRSGVCGTSIKWAGIEMTKKLKKVRNELGADFTIIGVGGVMSAQDYFEYKNAGADAVQSATGAMWNPYLAQEVKEKEEVKEALLEQLVAIPA